MSDELEGSRFPSWKTALVVAVPTAAVCIGVYIWYRHRKLAKLQQSPQSGTEAEKPAKSAQPSVEGLASSTVSLGTTDKPNDEDSPAETPLAAARGSKNKGNKFFKAGKFREAIEHYTEALKICPSEEKEDIAAFYQNRAAAYEQLSKKEVDEEDCLRQVVENCTEALKLNPRYVKALQRRAKAAQRLKDFELALRDLTAVCLLEGFKNPEPVQAADQVLKEVGRQKAKEAFRNRTKDLPSLLYISHFLDSFTSCTIDTPPTDNDNSDDSQPGLPDYWEAVSLVANRQYEGVIDKCTTALDQGLASKLADALLLRGTFLLLKMELEQASEDLGRVIEMEDSGVNMKVNALLKRANIHLALDNEKLAQSDFEEAVKLNQRDPDVYFHRAQFNIARNRLEEATNDFERVLSLNEDSIQAHVQLAYTQYKLAFVHQSMSKATEAIQQFEKACAKFPDSPEVCNVFAQVLLDKQEAGRAEEMFDKAIKLQPENPTSFVHKGLLLLQVHQNVEGCVGMIKKAMELDPKCDFAYETLAALEMQRGNVDQAIELFHKATSLARSESEMAQTFSLIEAAKAQKRVTSELGLAFAPHMGQSPFGPQ